MRLKPFALALAYSFFMTTWLGCGPDQTTGQGGTGGSGGGGPLDGLRSIDVTPPDATIFVTDGVAGTQDYTATGHFADGSTKDVTNLVGWSVEDGPLAYFPSGSHLVASGVRGGQTKVHATAGSIDGAVGVTVVIRGNHVVGGAPADSSGRFGGAADPSKAATTVYPADGVLLPPNLGTIEFQWQPAAGTDLYDLSFSSPYMDLHIYTTDNKYALSQQEWTWISETHKNSQVSWTVRATAQAGGGVGTATARVAKFAAMDVKGGLYYWSATTADTEGIWRFDFGATNMPPEKYLAQQDTGSANVGHCVACHVVSRDGDKMAFTYDGGNGPASTMDVATRSMLIPYNQIHSNFQTFSPDGTRMVTTYNGVLTLRDTASGASLGVLPTGVYATHPDWSPDGNHLVYTASAAGTGSDWTAVSGSIEIMDYTGGTWSTPRTLVQSQGENNYYPQFSPDGNWIVFNRAAGGNSYNNGGAEVWVVKADGTGQPIRLTAAHDAPNMTDSWPRWSPFTQTYGPPEARGPLMWITVSSKRAYGIEMAAGRRPQLWMFAFQPDKAAAGQDGSFPAFWLPFQNLATNNHIAQWTTRIIPVGIRGQGSPAPANSR